MSQKIYLVQYELDQDVPVDDTSSRIKSAYIPDELIELLAEKKLAIEIEIKESAGMEPDIPVTFIDDLEGAIHYLEANLVRSVQSTYEQISSDVLVEKEMDDSYRELLIFLKIREIMKLKQTKYLDNPQIKVIVG
ncbi:hypothetical protein FON35_23425 [Vibrio parahaemolyticus]|nr:hypothetical protein [Vibrio parahaemolyticus]